MMNGYRTGLTALVRLTLHAEDFEPWPDITRRFPQWTSDQIRRLERTARGSSPAQWRAREMPLSISRIQGAEAKTYTGSWHRIELRVLRSETALGVRFGGSVYFSVQHIVPGKPTAYAVTRQ